MAQNGTFSNDFTVKAGLAQMLKGGVIMDVVNAEQVSHWNISKPLNHIRENIPNNVFPSTGPHCRRGRRRSRHGAGACPRRYPR